MKRLQISINVALSFFCLGTLLFLIQLILHDYSSFMVIGFFYLITAIVVNLMVLLALIVALIVDDQKIKTLQSMGVSLSNIPIAALYAFIILKIV
ncbi:hypothetical protein [Ulvibacter antarcticus]|uniref:LIVCS family branched-chain amino acid:cation transporter n=1 Tax=Ulvibacter antarcticus TaxID=442714 RepID=A0A3L9YQI5_9FLAO|nr:hypothetical protein [Ulvibacter antarcticus]RMA56752.1 hypothetical protein BXY75_3268 [Ulvibacter antarcticus]